jgi:hypothetical protein
MRRNKNCHAVRLAAISVCLIFFNCNAFLVLLVTVMYMVKIKWHCLMSEDFTVFLGMEDQLHILHSEVFKAFSFSKREAERMSDLCKNMLLMYICQSEDGHFQG